MQTSFSALRIRFILSLATVSGFGTIFVQGQQPAVALRVPAKVLARPNPFAGNSRDRAAGQKLFEEHCAQCHGATADGSARGPSLLRLKVQRVPPGALFWILSNGIVRHGMPDWSNLPEPERWQIVTFLRSHKARKDHDGPGKKPTRCHIHWEIDRRGPSL